MISSSGFDEVEVAAAVVAVVVVDDVVGVVPVPAVPLAAVG